MTGQWEQYVEKAAAELELYPPEVARVVEFVAPLIAEDTRTRMVEAAGRIVEREGLASLYYCPAGDEIEQHPGGGFDICCDALDRHEPISLKALAAARREVAEEVAVAIEGQLVGLLDGFQARSAAAAAAREIGARNPS